MVQDFFHQYVAYISSFQVWGSDWPQKRFSARSMAKWIGTTNSSTIEAGREGVQHGIKTPPMGWYRIDMKLACGDWWMHILEAYVKILVTLECYKGLLDWFVLQFLLYVPIKMCQLFFVPPSRWAYNQTLRYAGLLHWGGHETDWEPGGSWATSTTFLIKTGAGCISCMRYGLLLIPSGLWLISSGLGWFTANKSTVEDQKCLRKKQEGHKTRLHKRRKISNSHRKVEHGISMNFLRFIHFATLLHSGNLNIIMI